MPSDATIQHKPPFRETGLAFENGQPVLIAAPDFGQDEPLPLPGLQLTTGTLLDLLLTGAQDADEIAVRALVLAMLARRPCAPANYPQLALWLEVSLPTARKKFTAVSLILSAIGRDLLSDQTNSKGVDRQNV